MNNIAEWFTSVGTIAMAVTTLIVIRQGQKHRKLDLQDDTLGEIYKSSENVYALSAQLGRLNRLGGELSLEVKTSSQKMHDEIEMLKNIKPTDEGAVEKITGVQESVSKEQANLSKFQGRLETLSFQLNQSFQELMPYFRHTASYKLLIDSIGDETLKNLYKEYEKIHTSYWSIHESISSEGEEIPARDRLGSPEVESFLNNLADASQRIMARTIMLKR